MKKQPLFEQLKASKSSKINKKIKFETIDTNQYLVINQNKNGQNIEEAGNTNKQKTMKLQKPGILADKSVDKSKYNHRNPIKMSYVLKSIPEIKKSIYGGKSDYSPQISSEPSQLIFDEKSVHNQENAYQNQDIYHTIQQNPRNQVEVPNMLEANTQFPSLNNSPGQMTTLYNKNSIFKSTPKLHEHFQVKYHQKFLDTKEQLIQDFQKFQLLEQNGVQLNSMPTSSESSSYHKGLRIKGL